MHNYSLNISAILITILLLCSCGHSLHFSEISNKLAESEIEGYYIPNVPFIQQKKHQCGPASLAIVLNYWGDTVSPEEIAQETYLPSIKGSLTFSLENYAQKRGFKTKSYRGSLDNLKEEIAQNHPLLILENFGLTNAPLNHYIVVIGYDDTDKVIIAHSDTKENALIPYKKILKSWEKADYWTLLILPK